MSDIVSSLKSFADILRMINSTKLCEWSTETFDNAVAWAVYIESIHTEMMKSDKHEQLSEYLGELTAQYHVTEGDHSQLLLKMDLDSIQSGKRFRVEYAKCGRYFTHSHPTVYVLTRPARLLLLRSILLSPYLFSSMSLREECKVILTRTITEYIKITGLDTLAKVGPDNVYIDIVVALFPSHSRIAC
jgi:hypothetical protein